MNHVLSIPTLTMSITETGAGRDGSMTAIGIGITRMIATGIGITGMIGINAIIERVGATMTMKTGTIMAIMAITDAGRLILTAKKTNGPCSSKDHGP